MNSRKSSERGPAGKAGRGAFPQDDHDTVQFPLGFPGETISFLIRWCFHAQPNSSAGPPRGRPHCGRRGGGAAGFGGEGTGGKRRGRRRPYPDSGDSAGGHGHDPGDRRRRRHSRRPAARPPFSATPPASCAPPRTWRPSAPWGSGERRWRLLPRCPGWNCFTRTAQCDLGTSLTLEGGQVLSQEPAGCPLGTTLVVRDLFYNTPARLKFMKRDAAEGAAVFALVQKLALSHPGGVLPVYPGRQAGADDPRRRETLVRPVCGTGPGHGPGLHPGAGSRERM